MLSFTKFIFRNFFYLAVLFCVTFSFVLVKVFVIRPTYETEAILSFQEESKPTELEKEELDIQKTISIIKRHRAMLESHEFTSVLVDRLSADKVLSEESPSRKVPAFSAGFLEKIFPARYRDDKGTFVYKDRVAAAIERLRKRNLSVEEIPFTNYIQIKAKTKNPQWAALLANTLCDTYIEWIAEIEKEKTAAKVRFVDGQMDKAKADLEVLEERLSQYKIKEFVSVADDAGDGKEVEVISLVIVGRRLERLISNTDLKLQQAQGNLAGFDFNQIFGSDDVRALKQTLEDLCVHLAFLELNYTKEHPQIIKKKNEFANLKQVINDNVGSKVRHQLPPDSSDKEVKEVTHLICRRITLGSQKQAVDKALANARHGQWILSQDLLPYQEKEINSLKREINMQERFYQNLVLKKQDLELSLSRSALELVRVLSKAPIPQQPKTPPHVILIFGFILSTALALAGIFSLEMMQSKVHDPAIMQSYLGIPYLGSIPTMRNPLKMFGDPRHTSGIKSYQLIHANLKNSGFSIYQIASARRKEGRTTTAVNLAKAFATGGNQVLLIEASSNRPSYSEIFRLEAKYTLADVLEKRTSLQNAVVPADLKNLSVLISGNEPLPQYLADALKNDVLACLEGLFKVVILDVDSLSRSAGALFIGRLPVKTVLVISAEHTKKEIILNAKQLLQNSNCDISGFVINQFAYPIPKTLYNLLDAFKFH